MSPALVQLSRCSNGCKLVGFCITPAVDHPAGGRYNSIMISMLALLAIVSLDQGATEWRQARTGTGYELALGAQPEILLQCTPGSRTVRLNVDGLYTGDGPEPRRLRIASGRTRATVPLRFDGSGNRGGAFAADIPISSPALTAFARTGRLTLSVLNGQVERDARTAAERAAISGFFASCRRR